MVVNWHSNRMPTFPTDFMGHELSLSEYGIKGGPYSLQDWPWGEADGPAKRGGAKEQPGLGPGRFFRALSLRRGRGRGQGREILDLDQPGLHQDLDGDLLERRPRARSQDDPRREDHHRRFRSLEIFQQFRLP